VRRNRRQCRQAESDLNEANLLDAVAYGADDEEIGAVSHVHGVGLATQVIVDIGGFLGIITDHRGQFGRPAVSLARACNKPHWPAPAKG
jgi:hypothetical protein